MPHDVVVREHPGAGRSDAAELVERLADDIPQRLRVPRRHQVREVEGLVHLVRTHPESRLLERRHPGLAAQRAVAVVLGEHLVPVAVDLVHAVLAPVRHVRFAAAHGVGVARRRVVGEALGLDHAVGDVHPEAVDPAVEPETEDGAELLLHLFVVPVEVGLVASKMCRYHWPGVLSASVTRCHMPPPNTDSQLFGGSSPFSPLPSRKMYRARSGLPGAALSGFLVRPHVLVGRVVRDQVDDHTDAAVHGPG